MNKLNPEHGMGWNKPDELREQVDDLMYLYKQAENDEVRNDALIRMEKLIAAHTAKAVAEAEMAGAAAFIKATYGERCKVKDTDDFPELKDNPTANRCLTCEQWERYDEWANCNSAPSPAQEKR